MPRWEYRKLDLTQAPRRWDDIDVLNEAGEQGWELVGVTNNGIGYLKRQIAEPATAAARTPSTQPPVKSSGTRRT
jgi:hypothetical protein